MPLNLASPGIVVREFDLTLGRVSPSTNKVGAIVAPFAKGPVNIPTLVENENDLLVNFGQPYPTDKHYEHWLTASSYLAYGGTLMVVRADDADFTNGRIGSATSVRIKSLEHYKELGYDETTLSNVVFAAKNPGSWSNGIRVAMIDSRADQILVGVNTNSVIEFTAKGGLSNVEGEIGPNDNRITGISTSGIEINDVVRCSEPLVFNHLTQNEEVTVTQIGISTVFLSRSADHTSGSISGEIFSFGSTETVTKLIELTDGIEQEITLDIPGSGEVNTGITGKLKGIVTQILNNSIAVKVLSFTPDGEDEYEVDYQPGGIYQFEVGSFSLYEAGESVSYTTPAKTCTSTTDWFDSQKIGITSTSRIDWSNLAPRPSTTAYAQARNSRFDELHVVVIDSLGKISGNAGTILEKHISLSKAKDAEYSVGSPSYWRKYLEINSRYIFGLGQPTGTTKTGFTNTDNYTLVSDDNWDQNAEGIIFECAGSRTNEFQNGKDYGGFLEISSTGALAVDLSELASGYDLFESPENYKIDFLLMGSAAYPIEEAQALANKLISVAELRKDAVAFISPYRGGIISDTTDANEVTVRSPNVITDNLISFYASVPSSSYAVFDSGYKYMYDRFSNTFRYIPLNGDIAGTCARNDINNFPWYSPAGTARGTILNAIKLAYNPTKSQRDKLYSNRINPVISSPGSGFILFGDKTGLSRASAFDRINVRRLFIYIENAISQAAKDVLFEFNDEVTRTNFVNTIEPFLRDVQAKRGIFDYIVICDETNNTAAVIDNNEFIADIYIKPARSINYIGLNFIATKTGVDFEEVIGNF